MLKILLSLLLLLPLTFGVSARQEAIDCDCPAVTNLLKTGQTSSSISYSWDAQLQTTQYRMWYTRQEDHYTSGYFYTSSVAFTFSNLSEGHYTFYFGMVCGEDASSFIGMDDLILD